MKLFRLPDLGEGLPDAEVREWYVKVGDEVEVDQPLVAMETAKALVDVPSPFAGKIEKLYGKPGDTIETGEPLIGFESQDEATETMATAVATATPATTTRVKATPAVRALAKKLGVNLANIASSGERITTEDVKKAAESSNVSSGQMEKLSAARRAMVLSMSNSHQQVAPVTLSDDADLHAWDANQDMTVRLLRALIQACQQVPALNMEFDSENMTYRHNDAVNIGIAVDTPHGLYVPVIKDAANLSDADLREKINQYKQQAQDKSIPQEALHGATITLSNFGTFAGRYANPIVTPPQVAIIGIGRARDEVVAFEGKPAVHFILPLSITFDHRAVTGGEAARFLKVLIDELQLEQ